MLCIEDFLSNFLTVSLSVCQFFCPSVFLSVSLCICQSVSLSAFQTFCLSDYPSVPLYLSIYVPIGHFVGFLFSINSLLLNTLFCFLIRKKNYVVMTNHKVIELALHTG